VLTFFHQITSSKLNNFWEWSIGFVVLSHTLALLLNRCINLPERTNSSLLPPHICDAFEWRHQHPTAADHLGLPEETVNVDSDSADL
jgi:hypothetical protein